MEKSNFTLSFALKSICSLVLLMFLGFTQSIYAQCSLAVNTNTQISLNVDCQSEIIPSMVLNDEATSCPGNTFTVNVQTLDHVNIPTSPIVTSEYINQTLIAQVVASSGNTGWGYIHIEDKMPPAITCVDTVVSCSNIGTYEPIAVDNCDPNPVITLVSQSEVVLTCDTAFIKEITRTYTATDNQGNVSLPCTQVIKVERIKIDSIEFPVDLSLGNMNAIQCDANYPKDENGNPDPSYTGVPTLDGNPLFPTTDLACNTVVGYSDVVLPSIGGVQKIMREWTVNEWYCNGSNTRTHMQIIEIVDTEGPVFNTCPTDMNISTTAGTDCEGVTYLELPALTDACAAVHKVDLQYGSTFIENYTSRLVSFPLGTTTATFTAYDSNNNKSTCTFNVAVADQTAPTVVCDQNTVVSLTLDGTALVNAKTFDDGSHDDCSDITFSVRRMDNGAPCGAASSAFDEYARFCCADVGNTVVVIMRVTDANGLYNECMVNVHVQDKLPPSIVCPADLTVNCDHPYDLNNLNAAFGAATAVDNCTANLVEETPVVNIDGCGRGTLTRTFTASDANGSATCQQVIEFIKQDTLQFDQILWPGQVDLSNCPDASATHPDQTGYPTWPGLACDKVGHDYDDKIFKSLNGEDACYKIIRTWEVADWCNLDPITGLFKIYKYQQIIRVINTDDPTFTGDYTEKEACTFDNNCNEGQITLGAAANDACTESLNWTYRVDYNNNGTFDFVSTTVQAKSIDASGTYPIGSHRIVYTAEDGCGNTATQTQIFHIVNCKAPTPYCLNGLAIELMPVDNDNDGTIDGGMVATWASDFDAGSFHACGYPVKVSFSADTSDTSREFTCANLGDNPLEIWAHAVLPSGKVISNYCVTNVNIQANNGSCDNAGTGNGNGGTSPLVNINGTVKNEMKDNSSDVKMILDGSELFTMTNTDGSYAFPKMKTGGTYKLMADKNEENKLNGITTLDIVLIQKHILGIEPFESPYKQIAADVNNDGKINGSDLISLRKLILGKTVAFENNKDWRFVDAAYKFVNPTNPLNEKFVEEYKINKLNSDMKVDFVSIKVGDLNNTAKVNLHSNDNTTRSNEALNLTVVDQAFEADEEVRVELSVEDAIELHGMQYTLQFNTMNLEYVGVESAAFDIEESLNVGMKYADQGAITVSLSEAVAKALDANQTMFTVIFKAKRKANLAGNISINNDLTQAEAYNNVLETMDVNLEVRDANNQLAAMPFTLYQNVPNPFTQNTNISFNLPETAPVQITVYDASGKMIFTKSNVYSKGMNTVDLDVAAFKVSGILYYQVKTKEHTATRKMVVLK